MDENTEPSSDKPPSTAAQVVGSTAGALVATTPLGPLVGAALTPGAIVYAEKVLMELRARTPRSVAMLLAHTAQRLDVDPDEIQPRADATPDGEALFADSVNAAAETIDQRKIAALALALANGVAGDRARIDQERLIVRALAQLEAPHIRVLARLRSKPALEGGPLKRTITQAEGAIIATLASQGLAVDDTREMAKAADAQVREQLMTVMKHMAQVQDARDAGRPAPSLPAKPSEMERWRRGQKERDELTPSWRRTPFGDRCLAYLRSAAHEAGLDASDLHLKPPR